MQMSLFSKTSIVEIEYKFVKKLYRVVTVWPVEVEQLSGRSKEWPWKVVKPCKSSLLCLEGKHVFPLLFEEVLHVAYRQFIPRKRHWLLFKILMTALTQIVYRIWNYISFKSGKCYQTMMECENNFPLYYSPPVLNMLHGVDLKQVHILISCTTQT